MDFFSNKTITKKIIVAILMVVLINFISPVISNAESIFDDIDLFSPFAKFINTIADLIMKGLQSFFVGEEYIKEEQILDQIGVTYNVRFSPGIIFSNKVAGLDINFFNPGNYDRKETQRKEIDKLEIDEVEDKNSDDFKSQEKSLLDKYGYNSSSVKKSDKFSAEVEHPGFSNTEELLYIYTWVYNDVSYYCTVEISEILKTSAPDEVSPDESLTYYTYTYTVYQEEIATLQAPESSASQLQSIIASWYKALRAIALVGLLSVLVYVGIRILISSTGQEKAKYKKIIIDWISAIFILFVLHYVMIFIIKISGEITKVLSASVLTEDGRDSLMHDIRFKLGEDPNFKDKFSELVIYLVLVIHTVMFTIQYLKRFIYMAFLTMIAPLIALTYPLDKIKDGQAQAFSIWLKEYIFNALLQPMHLLLYYIFVHSASGMTDKNPVYAIVAIGFMIPAEKFFRKMFGFEKAESASPIAAAAGGAAVMNGVNSIKNIAGKGASNKAQSSTTKSTPRYAAQPAASAPARTSSSGSSPSGSSPKGSSPKGSSPKGSSPKGSSPKGSSPKGSSPKGSSPKGSSPKGSSPKGNSSKESSLRVASTKWGQDINSAQYGTRNIKNGVKTLVTTNGTKAYRGAGKLARRIASGTVGLAGAATLGIIGLSAGIATGDESKAFGYGAAGLGAGFASGNALGEKAIGLGEKAVAFEKENREMYKEGTLGTEEYSARNIVKELLSDNNFNRMCKDLEITGNREKEAIIRRFLSNGIKEKEAIKKSMKVMLKNPETSQEEIIAAQKIRTLADRYEMNMKDIEEMLISKGVNPENGELSKAMSLIDLL